VALFQLSSGEGGGIGGGADEAEEDNSGDGRGVRRKA